MREGQGAQLLQIRISGDEYDSQSLKGDKEALVSNQGATVALVQLGQTVHATRRDQKNGQGEKAEEDLQAEIQGIRLELAGP